MLNSYLIANLQEMISAAFWLCVFIIRMCLDVINIIALNTTYQALIVSKLKYACVT